MLKKLYDILLNLVFPPKCPVCKIIIDKHPSFCGDCLCTFIRSVEIDPKLQGLTHLSSCYIVCKYNAGLKRLLHDLKYHNVTRYLPHFIWLLEQDKGILPFISAQVVLPVPLHVSRIKERGYNQTCLIFKEWAQKNGLSWEEPLVRTRATIPQWQLGRSERQQNIKGAFSAANSGLIQGKDILIVYDIITSGITLDECAAVLLKNGAVSVSALALAGAKLP